MGIKNKTLIDAIRRNDRYFEDYITRSVYHSNAIEGNTLSYYETYQIIFNCSSDEVIQNVKPRDLYEAINLKYAMDYIFRHLDEDVTVEYIIKLARIINKNINEISSFRTSSVFIMGAEHIPPKATEVPRLMNELLYTSFKSGDFLYNLADFHIRYERIHPFGDGNGRTGRVLLNKISLENGYLPFVIPKEKRDIYMNLLADCDIEGMKKFIEGLMKNEEKRMVEFGIDMEKFGFGMDINR
jgi:Fic family protein